MSVVRGSPYDTGIDPPAPVIAVRIGAPADERSAILAHALIDSGADMSVVPAAMAEDLRLPRVGRIRVRGVTGFSTAPVHAASLGILGVAHTYEVLATGDETILGRDVLNHYVVTLDGPALRTRVATPPRKRRA